MPAYGRRLIAYLLLIALTTLAAGCGQRAEPGKQAARGQTTTAASGPSTTAAEPAEDIPFAQAPVDDSNFSVQAVIRVEPAGDAIVTAKMFLSEGFYRYLKKALSWPQLRTGPDGKPDLHFPEPKVDDLLEVIGIRGSRAAITDIAGSFDDEERAIQLSFRQFGWALVRGGRWVRSLTEERTYRLKKCVGRSVLLEARNAQEAFRSVEQLKVVLPVGASGVEVTDDPNELTYTAPVPTQPAKVNGRPVLALEKPPYLLAALYKLYGDPKQIHFWAAKAVFRNDGAEALSDYKVRFRLAGYSGWSRWERCDTVYPGQTVVHPFYPVIDPKVRELQSATPADVEVEYSYRRPNGDTVADTHAQRLRILGFCEGVLTSREAGGTSWARFTRRAGPVLASFVTPGDPVILDLLGLASKRAGGVPASADDESALRFAAALHDIVRANIAYETTGGTEVDGVFAQHLKFGRDVLRTKSGTCVNLAILYASVFEAAGLDASITLIPRHAMPAFKLPGSKRLIHVEATVCGGGSLATSQDFRTAVLAAERRVQLFSSVMLVDETALPWWRKAGVFPPDLPDLGPNPLGTWRVQVPPQGGPAGRGAERAVARPGPRSAIAPVAGIWSMVVTLKGQRRTMKCSFRGEGTFTLGTDLPKPFLSGHYAYSHHGLALNYRDGSFETLPVEWSENKDAFVLRPAGGIVMLFKRQPMVVGGLTGSQIHNVQRGGEMGMVLRLRFKVNNAPGIPLQVSAWFADREGTWLKGQSEAYRSDKGVLTTRTTITPLYDRTEVTQADLFIPYTEFRLPPGEQELLFKVTVWCPSEGKELFQSPGWDSFKMVAGGP